MFINILRILAVCFWRCKCLYCQIFRIGRKSHERISNIDNKIVLNSSVTPDLLKELIHITQVLINLSRIIVGSKVVQKRLFLKWLLLNPVLTNKKLQISAVFPINFLINIDSCLNWQPHSDLNRDSRLERAVS